MTLTGLDLHSLPDVTSRSLSNSAVVPVCQSQLTADREKEGKKSQRDEKKYIRWRVTDGETQPGGHIRYTLVKLAFQTRTWQLGSVYLTRVENQAQSLLSILPSHLSPPTFVIGNIQFPLSCPPGRGGRLRREEDVDVGLTKEAE